MKNKIVFFDFDGCLGDTPLPEYGKPIWSNYHGKEWPFQGWWGRVESMCPEAFDIKLIDEQHQKLITYKEEGYLVFILTSRLLRFENIISDILLKHNIEIDGILTKTNHTKGERILQTVKDFKSKGHDISHTVFYDDRQKEIVTVEAVKDDLLSLGTTIDIIKVQSDALD